MIRVLITEDSGLIGMALKTILQTEALIEVVGWAKNGKECIDLCKQLKPDVITMDIIMPVMDGLEATRYIMQNMPCSILVVSAMVKNNPSLVFDLLKVGALDVIEKPSLQKGANLSVAGDEFIRKIKAVAKVRPFTKFKKEDQIESNKDREKGFSQGSPKISGRALPGVLVIGASTGGPPVLRQILSMLPQDFPLPVVITLHISRGFTAGLVDWLDEASPLKVVIGKQGQEMQNGTVYFPPDNVHIGVTEDHRLVLSEEPPIYGHRPSVDFLFESAAAAYGKHCTGLLLTGMGQDGASGLFLIKKSGGLTICQDKNSCAIFGMPKAAIALGAVTEICTIEKMTERVLCR